METICQLCELAATIIETAILLEFINKLLGTKYEGLKSLIQYISAFIVINTYMIFSSTIVSDYSTIADTIGILMYIAYSLFFTKSSVIYRVITPVLSVIAILLINLIISVVAANIFGYIPTELILQRNSLRLFLLFISKFAFFILTRIVLKISKPMNAIMTKRELAIISIVFIVSFLTVGFITEIYYSQTMILDVLLVLLLISLAIMDVAVFIILSLIAKKNSEKIKYSIMKAQFEEEKKSHDSVQSIYHSFQILQHDMKNELLLLYNMMDENRIDEAKRYITEYSKTKLNKFYEYVRTGNMMIDAIINVKLNIARERGIDVMCSINANFSNFDTDDILRLFSNTVDNAIESCQSQKEGRIKITMNNKRNYLFITVSNTIHSSVLKSNSTLKTTKKEKAFHGFGTQSMKYIAEKYDGRVDFYERNSMFIADIMLKNISNAIK